MEVENNSHDNSLSTTAPSLNYDGSIIPSCDQLLSDSVNSMAADTKLQFVDAIRNNRYNELEMLLDSRDGLLDILIDCVLNEQIDNDKTVTIHVAPLAFAATQCQIPILKLLLEHKADPDAEISRIGGTALHLAVRFGPKESVDLLLSKTTNINQQDRQGYSPLHLASRYGRQEIVASLLDANADFDLRDKVGNTAFHRAVMSGRPEILQLLYERGSEKYIMENNKYSSAPLHLAILNNQYDAAQWLLSSGAAINQPGNLGNTPLAMACAEGNVKIVDLLIHTGANIHKPNNESATPILIACYHAKPEVVKILYSCGASILDIDVRGNSCYHQVILSAEEPPIVLEDMFGGMFGAGADVNRPNMEGYPPLCLACQYQKLEHVKCLL